MKYEDTTHEERELILFIENNEEAFKLVTAAAENQPQSTEAVRAAAALYAKEYGQPGEAMKIFTLENVRNVRNYFRDEKPYSPDPAAPFEELKGLEMIKATIKQKHGLEWSPRHKFDTWSDAVDFTEFIKDNTDWHYRIRPADVTKPFGPAHVLISTDWIRPKN